MVAYQKEKTDNAICFFAKEYKKRTHKAIPQTILYKLLAFLDFYSVRDTGLPALGLKYCAMEMGPVPIELYKDKPETALYKFSQIEDNRYVIIAKGMPNLDYFSQYEIDEMNKLIDIHAGSSVKTKHISKASHDEIPAWKKAYQTKPNSLIDYKDMFDACFEAKESGKLSPAEERFIVQKCLTDIHE
jgi:uncharacterized phage-associated protein